MTHRSVVWIRLSIVKHPPFGTQVKINFECDRSLIGDEFLASIETVFKHTENKLYGTSADVCNPDFGEVESVLALADFTFNRESVDFVEIVIDAGQEAEQMEYSLTC